MPKYGFNGNIMIRCSSTQVDTLRKMLARQRVQPAELGRELIAAACAFLDAGGRLEFPLRIRPAVEEQMDALSMVAEDSGPGYRSVRELIADAKAAALQNPHPPPRLPDPPKSQPSAGESRGKKSHRKRGAS